MGLNSISGYEKLDSEDNSNLGYSTVENNNNNNSNNNSASIQQQTQFQQVPVQFVNPQLSVYPPQYYLAPQVQQNNQQQQQPQHPYYLPPNLQQQVPQQANLQPIYLQDYPPIPNVVVNTSRVEGEEDFNPALIILLCGFCVCLVWFFNIRYLKSKNKNARTIAICSVVFGVIYLVFLVLVFIPLMVRISNESRYYSRD